MRISFRVPHCGRLRLIVLGCCACLWHGCSADYYPFVPAVPPPSAAEVLADNLQRLTRCTGYTHTLGERDSFLIPLLPGIPLSLSDLSFAGLSGTDLFGNLAESDKAYRFAKLTERLYLCDSAVRDAGYTLPQAVDGDLTLDTYMSPTYNDTYRLTIPAMPLHDTVRVWTRVERRQFRCDSVAAGGRFRPVRVPVSAFSAELMRIPLLRCWLELPVQIRPGYSQRKLAWICELIVAKEVSIRIENPPAGVRFRPRSGACRAVGETPPDTELSGGEGTVVGLVCMIL